MYFEQLSVLIVNWLSPCKPRASMKRRHALPTVHSGFSASYCDDNTRLVRTCSTDFLISSLVMDTGQDGVSSLVCGDYLWVCPRLSCLRTSLALATRCFCLQSNLISWAWLFPWS